MSKLVTYYLHGLTGPGACLHVPDMLPAPGWCVPGHASNARARSGRFCRAYDCDRVDETGRHLDVGNAAQPGSSDPLKLLRASERERERERECARESKIRTDV